MKKRKITVLSATVLLAIVAFPLLTTAATEAPVRSIESFVLGTSGLQMNLQLAPDGSIVPGGATVGPAYVTPPPLVCPPDPVNCYDGGGLQNPSEPGNWYCPDGPPPETCAISSEGEMVRWNCQRGDSAWCGWQKYADWGGEGMFWNYCTSPAVRHFEPTCSLSPAACPLNDYCVEDCSIFDTSCDTGNFYCPDLTSNPPTGPAVQCWDGQGPPVWVCNSISGGGITCDWMYYLQTGWDSCTEGNFVSFTGPSCTAPPINAPIINAAAVAAPASFETLPISDIRGSLVCTGCDPVTNICDTSNGAICETREFVERNIMEEYEGSCVYKYTTTTGQTVTKTITGRPPSCP